MGYNTTRVNSALHPSGVAKSSVSFGWGKGGKVTAAGWQVTLCDPRWHVISGSGVMISIPYLLTYLLTRDLLVDGDVWFTDGSISECEATLLQLRLGVIPVLVHDELLQTSQQYINTSLSPTFTWLTT